MDSKAPLVIKFGGSRFDPDDLGPFAQACARIVATGRRVVLVHGGGNELSSLLKRLGNTPRFFEGFRVTDAETLDAAELVLSGRVNKRITRALQKAGVRAVGIAGTDAGLVRASVRRHTRLDAHGKSVSVDWGRVGDVTSIDPLLLDALSSAKIVPVVSPLGLDEEGEALNVNADAAAAAVAGALGAELLLLTNVAGVLRDPHGAPIPSLTPTQATALRAEGVILDGMIPKVESGMMAIKAGAASAVIRSMDAFLADRTTGTSIVAEDSG